MDVTTLNYGALILNRGAAFTQWLTRATSLAASNDPGASFGFNLANLIQVDDMTQADSSIILFNNALTLSDALVEKNSYRLLKLELQDWISDEKLWPEKLDVMTFVTFFDFSFCETVMFIHESNETAPKLKELEGSHFVKQQSLHLMPTPKFVDYINQILVEQKKPTIDYDNEFITLFDKIKCLFLLPATVTSPEEETRFIQAHFNLIHQSLLTSVLQTPPQNIPNLPYDEFTLLYRFYYHSRITTLM